MGGPFTGRSYYRLTDASHQKCNYPRIPNSQCKLELRLGIITFNNNKSEPLKTLRGSTCQENHMGEISRRRMAPTFIHYQGHEAGFKPCHHKRKSATMAESVYMPHLLKVTAVQRAAPGRTSNS